MRPLYQIDPTSHRFTRVRVSPASESKYAGLTGALLRCDPVSHATMNGGGWDCDIMLDANPFEREDAERKTALHESLGISAEYTQEHLYETRIRSTQLEQI